MLIKCLNKYIHTYIHLLNKYNNKYFVNNYKGVVKATPFNRANDLKRGSII